MNYKPLPELLKFGDRITCRRGVDGNPPEVLEVLKVYDDGRVLLVRENGNRAFVPVAVEILRGYDYELIEEDK